MVDLKRQKERQKLKNAGLCVSNHSQKSAPGRSLCESCLKLREDRRKRLVSERRCTGCAKPLPLDSIQKARCNICRAKYLGSGYGISGEEYTLLMLKGCFVCGSTDSLFLDHCHKTNKIRGALCRRHNSALGFLEDDESQMLKLLEYIRSFQ